jgi:hypothetical protein
VSTHNGWSVRHRQGDSTAHGESARDGEVTRARARGMHQPVSRIPRIAHTRGSYISFRFVTAWVEDTGDTTL